MKVIIFMQKKCREVCKFFGTKIAPCLLLVWVFVVCAGCSDSERQAEKSAQITDASTQADRQWPARTSMDGPPNVILFLVDDLRFDELGYTGYPAPTPHIDALAGNGVRFENAFVTSSLCSPSRASFLTGVYPHTHGVVGNLSDLNYEKTPTIAALLQEQGYKTALVGKWHMGKSSDARPGFNTWFAMPGQGKYVDPIFNISSEERQFEGYNSDIITDRALQFIDDNASSPFYLHLSYKAVHTPLTPASRHADGLACNDFKIKRPNAKKSVCNVRRRRAEVLMGVDDSVGRVVEYLQQKQLRNTMLVFTSDNGYLLREHDRGDKRLFYEESIRIPWVVSYPKLGKPGSSISEHILNIDFLPSVLDLAGVEIPAHIQGRSFIPLLSADENNNVEWRDHWVYEYFNETEFMHVPTHLAVVDDRSTYVRFPEGAAVLQRFSGDDLLFDKHTDPFEMTNVAASPEYAQVVAKKRQQLRNFVTETGFRYFDLDPERINKRIKYLTKAKETPWFSAAMQKQYPEGYPGWQPPERKPF